MNFYGAGQYDQPRQIPSDSARIEPRLYRCSANLWIEGLTLQAGQIVKEGDTGEVEAALIRAAILVPFGEQL